MRWKVKVPRRRGITRVSSQNQVTLPVDALRRAGFAPGDRLKAVATARGEIVLRHVRSPVEEFAGELSGVYPKKGAAPSLRDPWL